MRKTGSPIKLFGSYNLEQLYRQTISLTAKDLQLEKKEQDLLFAAVCLADIASGVCIDPETGNSIAAEVLRDYTGLASHPFHQALEAVQEAGLISYLRERDGSFALVLSAFFRRELEAVWQKNQVPLLLIRKKAGEVLGHGHHGDIGPRSGYIYIAYAENGLFLIGKSRSPQQHIKQLSKNELPFDIALMHSIFSQDMHQAETMIRQKLSHRHRSGQWFALSPQDLNDLMNIAELRI
ncbi:GIY-YIG nuclease family protein [Chloroflexia bacterium SDU3-3]|nr:GIY-YIG nuclease family protein [Chloroflexia bacterium SDU3-3]